MKLVLSHPLIPEGCCVAVSPEDVPGPGEREPWMLQLAHKALTDTLKKLLTIQLHSTQEGRIVAFLWEQQFVHLPLDGELIITLEDQ